MSEGATMQDAVVRLSEGNPGALTVLLGLLEANRPDLVAYLYILSEFGETELKGSGLWIAYKDHNGEDMDSFIMDLELKMMTEGPDAR